MAPPKAQIEDSCLDAKKSDKKCDSLCTHILGKLFVNTFNPQNKNKGFMGILRKVHF